VDWIHLVKDGVELVANSEPCNGTSGSAKVGEFLDLSIAFLERTQHHDDGCSEAY
jgi:hypothetical protein